MEAKLRRSTTSDGAQPPALPRDQRQPNAQGHPREGLPDVRVPEDDNRQNPGLLVRQHRLPNTQRQTSTNSGPRQQPERPGQNAGQNIRHRHNGAEPPHRNTLRIPPGQGNAGTGGQDAFHGRPGDGQEGHRGGGPADEEEINPRVSET